jgi:hypothetical protein
MLRYEFTNPQDIPDDLIPGVSYTTKVESATFEGHDFIVTLKYIGEIYDSNVPTCLFSVSASDISNDLVHPFVD